MMVRLPVIVTVTQVKYRNYPLNIILTQVDREQLKKILPIIIYQLKIKKLKKYGD